MRRNKKKLSTFGRVARQYNRWKLCHKAAKCEEDQQIQAIERPGWWLPPVTEETRRSTAWAGQTKMRGMPVQSSWNQIKTKSIGYTWFFIEKKSSEYIQRHVKVPLAMHLVSEEELWKRNRQRQTRQPMAHASAQKSLATKKKQELQWNRPRNTTQRDRHNKAQQRHKRGKGVWVRGERRPKYKIS